ncbi:Glycosyltransferases, probably involved in cell wall biogenesis [Alteromonadaceae bacterium Bs31]|nr:Glycosyltransferases, probably involved in cell wall biogenesis [Alteromonadaceae bacterium Bs31]
MKLGEKVHLLSQKNGGVSKARNTGIAHASGTHIALMDADDRWRPGYTAKIHQLYNNFPQAKAFASAYVKLQGNSVINPKIRLGNIKKDCILSNYFAIAAKGDLPFMTSSICIEKQFLMKTGGFPEGEPMGEDQDVWARLSLTSKIAYSPEILSCYVLDAENRACHHNTPKRECPFSQRLNNAVIDGEIPSALRASVLKYTATHLIHLATALIDNHEFEAAKKLLSDKRCRKLPIKRLKQQLRLHMKSLRQMYSRTLSSDKPSLESSC